VTDRSEPLSPALFRAVAKAFKGINAELGRRLEPHGLHPGAGMPGGGDYGAAKAGLHGLARSLAWELGRDGILVNVIDTGFTLTERNLGHFDDEARQRVSGLVPSRRLSTPEEVARLVVFLGSAANGNISGEIVREGSSTAGSAHTAMVA
jgi:NAD(P)-dependent dehydrogenase (short-subunit alcohol dehydrogenase family)